MTMYRFFWCFCLFLIITNVQAQLQEALIKANELKNKSPQEAKEYAEQAEKLAKRVSNDRGLADAYAILGYLQAVHFDSPDLAYESHAKAYNLYKNLYNKGYLDKDDFYHFLNEVAIPTYKYVEGVDSRKKRYRKAVTHYKELNSKFALDLSALATLIRQDLEAKQREVKAKEAKIDEANKDIKEKDKKIATTTEILQQKRLNEVTLIEQTDKLKNSLGDKQQEALRLIDSLYDSQVMLNQQQLEAVEAKAKQAEAEKATIEADSKTIKLQAASDRQQSFIIIMAVGGLLGVILLVVIVAAYLQQQKTARQLTKQRDLLTQQNAEIKQQQEEIVAQSENIQQQNTMLQQQTEEITAQRDNLAQQHLMLDKQRIEIEKQRDESEQLLLNILPEEVATELKSKGKATPQSYEMVTVMFTDFKGFTKIAEKLTPEQIVAELDRCFLAFDEILERFEMEKIKTMGDGYMCAGGLPVSNKTNPIDAVRAGLAMQEFMYKLKLEKEAKGEPVWELRLGVHTGPVVAGVVGKRKFAYDIWGDTVNVASRMESSGEAGKVNISGATYEYVKSYFNCMHRGKIMAKNKGEIDMYFVESKSSLLQSVQNLINA